MSNLEKLTYQISGVNVHALQPRTARDIVLSWFNEQRKFHYISSTNINNILISVEDKFFFKVTNTADLSLPDGMPLIWYGRFLGYKLPKRCGIEELMIELFELSNEGYNHRHFFYGNTPEVLKDLKTALLKQYPNLNIAGMYSPPFRDLTPEEDDQMISEINSKKPDFIWVSLGCPKQEKWLFNHRDKLDAVAGGGAGAVFNFLSGHSPKAPNIIRYSGLEWFMRLVTNPKKLAHRYLYKYPMFFLKLIISGLSSKKK